MSSSQNLIVIGYAKLPAASASHSVHEYVSIVLLVDGSTGHVSEVDSTAVTALVRAFIRELLLGQDLTQSVEPILTEIDRSYLGHAAASIKQAVSDAWRRYAAHRRLSQSKARLRQRAPSQSLVTCGGKSCT